MDNLKYYNNSLSHDFSMFMPKEHKENIAYESVAVATPKARAKAVQKRKAATKHLSVSAFSVLVALFFLSVLCANLALRLKINEINSDINDIKSEIKVLDSEKKGLIMEYEERISYSNIELEAAELGMCKMDKSQVKYIRVNDKNIAVTKDGTTVSEK